MAQNGNQVQSFGYDAHDKLMSGIGESEGYDANGNLMMQTVNGQHTSYTYDDEDRLTSVTLPDGHTDSFSYNGLGMRLTKNDPTGNYAYYTDGVSPASDVLSDNYSTFTPGISEINGQGSRFYLADASGNSRGLLNSSQTATDGYNWNAFGNLVSRFGSNPTGFAWNEASGYQSDADDGLTLLGHRYYDKRIGRFISQDHAKSGDNWYQYADNDPMNEVDALGQEAAPFSVGGNVSEDQIIQDAIQDGAMPGEEYDVTKGGKKEYTFVIPNGSIFDFMGVNVLMPPGTNIDRNIMAAKNFMASPASKSEYHYGWHGSKTGLKYDVNKIAAWLIKNADTGLGQDYKKGGKAYDKAGHLNYAAVATQLGFDMDSIILGQQFIHEANHPFSGLEPTGTEYLGAQYDQQLYHPGKALFDSQDALDGFANYKYGL